MRIKKYKITGVPNQTIFNRLTASRKKKPLFKFNDKGEYEFFEGRFYKKESDVLNKFNGKSVEYELLTIEEYGNLKKEISTLKGQITKLKKVVK